MKQLLAGATVYDGSGALPRQADVLMQDDRILAVEPGLRAREMDAETLDVTGLTIAPGFIDMHRHADIAALRDADFGLLELAQGITTTAVGNCGIAPVPISAAYRKEYCDFMEPVVGEVAARHAFADYAAYFSALEAASPALNMGVMAGTGAIKVAVKGFGSAPYTSVEMAQAQDFVAQAINQGALGVSLGFMYQPECYTTPAEQAQVIAPAAKAGRLLTTHIRGEGDSLVSSVREVIGIARETGIRLHISHFKATGIRNWGRLIYEAVAEIETARADGLAVTADFYPYAGGSTTLFSLIPPSLLQNGNDATLRFLATQEGKRKLREEVGKAHADWDNMALSIGWDRILIASTRVPAHAAYGGRDIAALATQTGYAHPSDFVCDLMVEEAGQVGIVVLSMDEKDVDAVARLPFTAVVSDALYGGGKSPHPRLYGSFPRVIRDFVLDRKVLPLETAIYKMTGMPAKILGLSDRGLVKAGCVADLTVFDPIQLQDHARYGDSRRLSTGMDRVILSGRTVFARETMLDNHAGGLLRAMEK